MGVFDGNHNDGDFSTGVKREWYDMIGEIVKVVPKCGYKHEEKYRGKEFGVVALDVTTTQRTGIPAYRLHEINDAVFYDFELVKTGRRYGSFKELS